MSYIATFCSVGTFVIISAFAAWLLTQLFGSK